MSKRAVTSIAMAGLVLGGLPALAADRWTGTSTAQDSGTGRCGALSFELTIDGATVGGTATSPGGRGQIRWQVAGRRDGAVQGAPLLRLQLSRWRMPRSAG